MMLIGIVTPTVTGYITDLIGIRYMFMVLVPPILSTLILLLRYVATVDKPC